MVGLGILCMAMTSEYHDYIVSLYTIYTYYYYYICPRCSQLLFCDAGTAAANSDAGGTAGGTYYYRFGIQLHLDGHHHDPGKSNCSPADLTRDSQERVQRSHPIEVRLPESRVI